ncbi:MAG TPA: hypothetical protein VET48_08825, partial [Steroidobacteraceae bacterium]|nr:hypothetical protein [Steroidobacteraceae bacterium]
IPCGYMVRVLAPTSDEGPPEVPLFVDYDDEHVEFSKAESTGGEGANIWYRVELPRADHRAAVRALFESRNLKVSRMMQVAFGSVELPRDLPRGRYRALSNEQVSALYELAQLKAPSFEPRPEKIVHRSARRPVPDRRRSPKRKVTARRSR